MPGPEATVIISTYQRPYHLARCLESIAMQQDAADHLEVVVTDDGSQDETQQVVREFAEGVSFPVTFSTHDHQGFRLARCRNEGVLSSTGRYLIFLDGDLLIPPDFVQLHLHHRRPGTAVVGDTCWLDEEVSRRVTSTAVRSGSFLDWTPKGERRRLRWKAARAGVYARLRLPNLPRLKGGNLALWRDDFERVNGYDEEFVGWGLEDTDLQRRLWQAGVRFLSSMHWTRTYHLWHPRDPSFVPRAQGTKNEWLLKQEDRPLYTQKGLTQHHDHAVVRWNRPAEGGKTKKRNQARVA